MLQSGLCCGGGRGSTGCRHSLAALSSVSGEQSPCRRRAVWQWGWRGGGGVCTTPSILHLCSEWFSFLEVPEGIDCGAEEMEADGQVFLEHQSFLHEKEVLKYLALKCQQPSEG